MNTRWASDPVRASASIAYSIYELVDYKKEGKAQWHTTVWLGFWCAAKCLLGGEAKVGIGFHTGGVRGCRARKKQVLPLVRAEYIKTHTKKQKPPLAAVLYLLRATNQ